MNFSEICCGSVSRCVCVRACVFMWCGLCVVLFWVSIMTVWTSRLNHPAGGWSSKSPPPHRLHAHGISQPTIWFGRQTKDGTEGGVSPSARFSMAWNHMLHIQSSATGKNGPLLLVNVHNHPLSLQMTSLFISRWWCTTPRALFGALGHISCRPVCGWCVRVWIMMPTCPQIYFIISEFRTNLCHKQTGIITNHLKFDNFPESGITVCTHE